MADSSSAARVRRHRDQQRADLIADVAELVQTAGEDRLCAALALLPTSRLADVRAALSDRS